MNARFASRLQLSLMAGLALGCDGSTSPDAVTGPLLEIAGSPTAAVLSLDNPLRVTTGLRVTNPTAVEFNVHFVGIDPIENLAPKPIQLDLETEVGGIVTPSMISLTIVSEAWAEHPKAVGTYVIEEPAPELLPAVQIWQAGQVVADLTPSIESFEARLWFDANEKAWALIAELVSTASPSLGPSLVTGTHSTRLTVGPDQLTADIRESEAQYDVQPVLPLHVALETKAPSGGGIFNRWHVGADVRFGATPIVNGAPVEIQLDLQTEINFTPITTTFHVQSQDWAEHPKVAGAWVIEAEASSASLPAVQMSLDGELVADLTKSITKFEALLRLDANQKAWILNLIAEFDGNDEGATDGLSLLTAAHIAELRLGVEEQLSVGIRESGATYDVQPVF